MTRAIDMASNFLQFFRMQIIFPRPGGGTIAAGNRDSEKVAKQGVTLAPKAHNLHVALDHFGSHFPSKMHSKINAKPIVGKLWYFMRKCSQTYAKTMSKIDDKSMKFRNLRFLVFCE